MNRKMKKRTALALGTVIAFLAGAEVSAGELRVQAPVVEVEPISAPPTRIEHCDDKPMNGTLAQTLAWDLGLNCREEVLKSGAITGYRVFYRWDDRVYSRVMAAAPGATIPLKVRID